MRGQSRIEYLYEDSFLIAVNKPEGLAVISPEGSRSKSLYDIVTDHIRRRNPKGRAAVVHRIDRDTSGLVLFAKDGWTKKILMDNWDSMVKERLYYALVRGKMESDTGVFDSYLLENRAGEVYEVDKSTRGAKQAITSYKVIGTNGEASLLCLELKTGRKHQIRVQLAARSHPVLGDPKYGGQRSRESIRTPSGRLFLHAASLRFIHPKTRGEISLSCPPPQEFFSSVGLEAR
jgi:23S rRNA pseudouridine1911/1915/1917 synthase